MAMEGHSRLPSRERRRAIVDAVRGDGGTRRPLGLVIVGGLIVSQFITLYITSVICLYLERFQEKVLDRTSFFRAARRRPGGDAEAPLEVEPAFSRFQPAGADGNDDGPEVAGVGTQLGSRSE